MSDLHRKYDDPPTWAGIEHEIERRVEHAVLAERKLLAEIFRKEADRTLVEKTREPLATHQRLLRLALALWSGK